MKKTKVLIGLAAATLVLAGCGRNKPVTPEEVKTYTFHTYTTVSPSNWNALTSQDANDNQIQGYVEGSLVTFNYKFDSAGKIVDGDFAVEYDGATKIEDVTSAYATNDNYDVPDTATKGYAYKITLRDDLKWDDGTAIKADDFLYSMEEQLNPLFLNYRSDSYYGGSLVIHNAERFLKQGQSGYFAAASCYKDYNAELDENLFFSADEKYQDINSNLYASLKKIFELDDDDMEYYGIATLLYYYNDETAVIYPDELAALEGKSLKEIKEDADLLASYTALKEFWVEESKDELDFFVANYTFPAMTFDKVGLIKGANDLELIMILDKSLILLDESGNIGFKTAYNFGSLPLVKRDLYEANKKAPADGATLWTSSYNSSAESTASWGPYKLTSFQAGKQYVLERNPYWYGYNMDSYKGQYQTDKIVCDTIAEWNTAWQIFQKGDLTSIGLNVTIAQDYNKSSRAFFSGDDYIYTLQLQSNATALKGRETEGVDKEILTYVEFRKAISLAINRAEYASATTTASQAGFGIFNMYHYYDIEHGKAYRNEDCAKQVICETYGVNVSDYASLDEAYAAVNGYNVTMARELVTQAYNKAFADGKISATDVVKLTYGSSEDNSNVRRFYDNLDKYLQEMVKGTPLENRFELEFDSSFGTKWATDFRAGAYDMCMAGWSGAALDPGFFLTAYLADQYRYAQGWKPGEVNMTYNPWGDTEDGHKELTMDLLTWWDCLNGTTGAEYDWSEGNIDNDFRCKLIAQLERQILITYYAVPLMYWYGATILSYKCEYASSVDNTIMGFGGLRYLKYNYSDQEWESVKATFDYKK